MTDPTATEQGAPVTQDSASAPGGTPEPPFESPLREPPPAAARASVAPSEDAEARRQDRVRGTVIVVVGFVVSLGISLWAKQASRPEVSDPPGPPTKVGVIGYPEHVDVVASLPVAKGLTKRPMLRGIIAEGVRSDGTVDVSEGPGRVRYTFQSPPGHGAQPPREPGTLPRQHYCGKQSVVLRKEGLAADHDKADSSCPSKHLEPLPDPACSFKQIWQHALAEGAPDNRLARIEYYRSRSGPAYRFEIQGTKHRFSMHGDCERRLTGSEGANTAP